jgi:hypothetical protein
MDLKPELQKRLIILSHIFYRIKIHEDSIEKVHNPRLDFMKEVTLLVENLITLFFTLES